MAVVNPPGFLQNAGGHTSEQLRDWHNLLISGKTGATSLVARGGVHPALGNALVVTQTGSPSMAVIVKSGAATISGTEGSKQGVYSVLNDADVTLSITAAHATLNRIDLACFKVEDQAYSGSVNSSSLVIVTGTPASSPSAPTAPNNSITLAQIFVGAAVSSIVTANITDTRPMMASLGAPIPVSGATEEGTLTAYETLAVYRRDTDTVRIYDGGAFREYYPAYRTSQVLGVAASTVTFSSIPTNLKRIHVQWTARGDAAVTNDTLLMRINNNSGANYYYQWVQGVVTGTVQGNFGNGAAAARVGYYTGANAAANVFSSGSFDITGWDSPHATYLGYNGLSQSMITFGSVHITDMQGGVYSQAGPYNRIDFLTTSGNFIAGSAFYIDGSYS